MKIYFRASTMLPVLVLMSSGLFAQDENIHKTPKWVPDNGYWVIERKVDVPERAVIHFYNNDNIEVYSEKVTGFTINLKKRKTLMRLKKALDQSLLAWDQSSGLKVDAELVGNIFNHKQRSR